MITPAEVRANYMWEVRSSKAPSPEAQKSVNVERARRIADEYDKLPAYDSAAMPAYERLARELNWQMAYIMDAGYTVEFYTGTGEPYANSAAMREDVLTNGHLYIFSTRAGYGEGEFVEHWSASHVALVDQPNPMLKHTHWYDVNEQQMLVNDVFRAVHDFFGHAVHGYQFGPVGEDNAFREHASMFSELAVAALTTETRGQNSWVNFGAHLRRPDGTLPVKGDADYIPAPERKFAEQKLALLPYWAQRLDNWTPVVQESWGY